MTLWLAIIVAVAVIVGVVLVGIAILNDIGVNLEFWRDEQH